MKLILFSLLIVGVIAVSGLLYFKYRLDHAPDKRNLEASIDAEVGKYQSKMPKPLIVGVYKDGRFWTKGYEDPLPSEQSRFEIASVSKLFTASLLQILSDEGKLSLDSTLGQLVGKKVAMAPEVQAITLRQLATHTSGLPGLPKGFLAKMGNQQNPYAGLEQSDLYVYLKNPEGKRSPGRFEYSNLGMGLLGHVLEWVTGKDLQTLASEKIFTPLSMQATNFDTAALVQGFDEKGQPNPSWDLSVLPGAGAFKSTMADMLRFAKANLEPSDPLWPSLHKMHPQQGQGPTGIAWMQPTFIDRIVGNQSMVWHNGRTGGFTSYISVDPGQKTAVVILSAKSVDITMLGMMLTRQIRSQSWK